MLIHGLLMFFYKKEYLFTFHLKLKLDSHPSCSLQQLHLASLLYQRRTTMKLAHKASLDNMAEATKRLNKSIT